MNSTETIHFCVYDIAGRGLPSLFSISLSCCVPWLCISFSSTNREPNSKHTARSKPSRAEPSREADEDTRAHEQAGKVGTCDVSPLDSSRIGERTPRAVRIYRRQFLPRLMLLSLLALAMCVVSSSWPQKLKIDLQTRVI